MIHGNRRPDSEDWECAQALRRSLGKPALSATQLTRVRAAVETEWQQSIAGTSRPGSRWAIAAAVLLVAGAAAGLWTQALPASGPIVATVVNGAAGSLLASRSSVGLHPLTAGASLRGGDWVEARQTSVIRWLQGGSLRMKPGTRIHAVSARELVLESGSIYVAMTEPHAPGALVVRTPYGVVEHIGTQFMVTVDSSAIDLRVREGSVRLTANAITPVNAGEAVQLTRGGTLTRLHAMAHDPAWDWVGQPLERFDPEGQSMLAMLQWAAHEKSLALDFSNDTARKLAGQTILHGSIEGLSVDQALAVMLATTTLSADAGDSGIRVHAAAPTSTDLR